MKIEQIEKIQNGYIEEYHVTLIPNRIEEFFGKKKQVMRFKDSGRRYTFGGGTVYIRDDGEQTYNGSKIGESIDKWRNSF